jgi:hypothetical protein
MRVDGNSRPSTVIGALRVNYRNADVARLELHIRFLDA